MQQNTMQPEQAIKLLDQVAANVQLSRADHVAVQQAVTVLQELITSKATKPEKAAK